MSMGLPLDSYGISVGGSMIFLWDFFRIPTGFS
jgi:hypothetical protein